jgi:hypothetical protein
MILEKIKKILNYTLPGTPKNSQSFKLNKDWRPVVTSPVVTSNAFEPFQTEGKFGPSAQDKVGSTIYFFILLAILNYVSITAPYPFGWQGQVLFNIAWLAVFYFALPKNVYIENGSFVFYKSLRKKTVNIKDVISLKKEVMSGYRGLPYSLLGIDVQGQKSISIGHNWKIEAIVELIKALKQHNPSITVSEDFDQLTNATNAQEFVVAKKAYKHKEIKAILWAGLFGLGVLVVIYGLWFLTHSGSQ